MNRKVSFNFLVLLLLGCFANSLTAQLKEGETIDKIAAIVGNEIIMQSDVNAYIAMLAQQNPSTNPNDPALKKKVLNALIDEKLVIMKAIEDSIVASDEEINAKWDYHLNMMVRQVGSEKRLEDIYGMSIARLKYEYHDEIRKQILSEKIRMKKFGSVTVSPREVEEFYAKYKDSIPAMPAQVELYHIVRNLEVKTNKKDDIYALAMKVRDSLIAGKDFADFCKRYSGDPGTSATGGELGWLKKNKLVPEFEKAAFALQIGDISLPVETPFGFHLIQVIEKKKDEINAKHILFKIEQSQADKDNLINFLKELKAKVEKGEKFEDLAKKYSDEKETQGFGGLIGKINLPVSMQTMYPFPYVPSNLDEIINKLPEGGISDPMQYGSEPKVSYRIIYKKKSFKEHKADLKEDYKDVEKYALNNKQIKMNTEWIETLRKEIYWEIKE